MKKAKKQASQHEPTCVFSCHCVLDQFDRGLDRGGDIFGCDGRKDDDVPVLIFFFFLFLKYSGMNPRKYNGKAGENKLTDGIQEPSHLPPKSGKSVDMLAAPRFSLSFYLS